MKRLFVRLVCLFSHLLAITTPVSAEVYNFSYSVQAPGSVAVGVVDARNGSILRQLLMPHPTNPGQYSISWDGFDEFNRPADPLAQPVLRVYHSSDPAWRKIGRFGSSRDPQSPNDPVRGGARSMAGVARYQTSSGEEGIILARGWSEQMPWLKKASLAGVFLQGPRSSTNGLPMGVAVAPPSASRPQYFFLSTEGSSNGRSARLLERWQLSDMTKVFWDGGDRGSVVMVPDLNAELVRAVPDSEGEGLRNRLFYHHSLAVVGDLVAVALPMVGPNNRGAIRLYAQDSGALVTEIPVERPMYVSADSLGRIWSVSLDRTVRIHTTAGQLVATMHPFNHDVDCFSFNPNEQVLVCDAAAGRVRHFRRQNDDLLFVAEMGQKALAGDLRPDAFHRAELALFDSTGAVWINDYTGAGRILRKFASLGGPLRYTEYGSNFVGHAVLYPFSRFPDGTTAPAHVWGSYFNVFDVRDSATGDIPRAAYGVSNASPYYYIDAVNGPSEIIRLHGVDFLVTSDRNGVRFFRIDYVGGRKALHLAAMILGKQYELLVGFNHGKTSVRFWGDVRGNGTPDINDFQEPFPSSWMYNPYNMHAAPDGDIVFIGNGIDAVTKQQGFGIVEYQPSGFNTQQRFPLFNNPPVLVHRLNPYPTDPAAIKWTPQVRRAGDGSYYGLALSQAYPNDNTLSGQPLLARMATDGTLQWVRTSPNRQWGGFDIIPPPAGLDTTKDYGVVAGAYDGHHYYHIAPDGLIAQSFSLSEPLCWLDTNGALSVARHPTLNSLVMTNEECLYMMYIGIEGHDRALTAVDYSPTSIDRQRSTVGVEALTGVCSEDQDKGSTRTLPRNCEVTFWRTGDVSSRLSVNTIIAGQATPGVHFDLSAPTPITFSPGQRSLVVALVPRQNNLFDHGYYGSRIWITVTPGNGYQPADKAFETSVVMKDTDPYHVTIEPFVDIDGTVRNIAEHHGNPAILKLTRTNGRLDVSTGVNVEFSGEPTMWLNFAPGSASFAAGQSETYLRITSLPTAVSTAQVGTARVVPSIPLLEEAPSVIPGNPAEATFIISNRVMPSKPILFMSTPDTDLHRDDDPALLLFGSAGAAAVETEFPLDIRLGGTARLGVDYEVVDFFGPLKPRGAAYIPLRIKPLPSAPPRLPGEPRREVTAVFLPTKSYATSYSVMQVTIPLGDNKYPDNRRGVWFTSSDGEKNGYPRLFLVEGGPQRAATLHREPGQSTTHAEEESQPAVVSFSTEHLGIDGIPAALFPNNLTTPTWPRREVEIPAGAASIDFPLSALTRPASSPRGTRGTLVMLRTRSDTRSVRTSHLKVYSCDNLKPAVELSPPFQRVSSESPKSITMKIRRCGGGERALPIALEVSGGAQVGRDYLSVPTSVTVPINSDELRLQVEVNLNAKGTLRVAVRPTSDYDITGMNAVSEIEIAPPVPKAPSSLRLIN